MPIRPYLCGVLCSFALTTGLAAQAVPDAELPRAEHAIPIEPAADVVTIDLARDGTLMIDGMKVGYAELSARLVRRAAADAGDARTGPDQSHEPSRAIVHLRAHAHVPTGAVGKVLLACTREDVGSWKFQLATRGGTALSLQLPDSSIVSDGHTVHIEHTESAGAIDDLAVRLTQLARDPARRVRSPTQPDSTVPPPILVESDGDVAWSFTIAAIDRAIAAGIVEVWLDVRSTGEQDVAWAETRDIAVLVDATEALETPPSFRLTAPEIFHAGGAYGARVDGRARLARTAPAVAGSIEASLQWLAATQAPDGGWGKDQPPVQLGDLSLGEVGITSLALLAFLGDGSTMRGGPHVNSVKLATTWLRDRQDPNSGRFATAVHPLEHALATLAITESYGVSDYKILKRNAQLAITHLEGLDFGTDPLLVAWRSLSVAAANGFRLVVDPNPALQPAVADPSTSPSLLADAAGVFADFVRGHHVDPMNERVQQIVKALPLADASVTHLDPMTWFFASHALFQVGGKSWQGWSARLTTILPSSMIKTGEHAGSWSITDATGKPVDRTYSTALLCLALESHYRVARMVR